MTAVPHDPEMRNPRSAGSVAATIVVTCLAVSCAGTGNAPPPNPAPATADAAADATPVVRIVDVGDLVATPVVQIHNVRDLVTPPGETSPDTDRTEQLAEELRRSLTFVGGSAADQVELTAFGGELIVRAPQVVQAQIRSALLRRREMAGGAPR